MLLSIWLTWEMVTLLTERGETGLTGLYARDNQFGCGNFGLRVLWENLVIANLSVCKKSRCFI